MDAQVIRNTEAEADIGFEETSCAHQRLIDDILTKSGKRTGKVRCLECRAIFDDPYKGLK
ncbi:MAG: hypothetical protein KF722_07070 [Nitrospira sp.]|nr:hypothetical protein [Nitrospira sp.]